MENDFGFVLHIFLTIYQLILPRDFFFQSVLFADIKLLLVDVYVVISCSTN